MDIRVQLFRHPVLQEKPVDWDKQVFGEAEKILSLDENLKGCTPRAMHLNSFAILELLKPELKGCIVLRQVV